MMAHHHRWRMIVPLDQQPRFLPDRQRHRADDARHPLVAQPAFGGVDQRARGGCVLRLEQAEKAGAGAKALFGRHFEREPVDMRADPSDRAAVAFGEEQLRLRMAEPAVFARVDHPRDLAAQRRHPIGVVAIEAIGQVDECARVGRAVDRADGKGGVGQGSFPSLKRWRDQSRFATRLSTGWLSSMPCHAIATIGCHRFNR